MSEYRITSHMSIDEAQEQGLTQIVKGRPRKEDKVSFSTAKKMIRVNINNLT